MSNNNSYTVGKGKPPKSGQFKKGKSGNPLGRPKATKNLKTDLAEELGEKITLREGAGSITLSKQRAMLKRLVVSALQGNVGASTTVLNMVMKLIGEGEPEVDGRPLTAQEKTLLDRFTERQDGRTPDHDVPTDSTVAPTDE